MLSLQCTIYISFFRCTFAHTYYSAFSCASANWEAEFKRFAPEMSVQKYVGDKEARQEIRKEIVEFILAQPKAKHKVLSPCLCVD
jgi:hypothetical protein